MEWGTGCLGQSLLDIWGTCHLCQCSFPASCYKKPFVLCATLENLSHKNQIERERGLHFGSYVSHHEDLCTVFILLLKLILCFKQQKEDISMWKY